ncbi:uncharacterized protein Pyn_31229 [Prunus yedoensis var. nudiflora]|uniref:Probable quinone oxidoreductase n=1 Tax=Prunus yedoensis var. nudiflora TaxID=2094558 RepID=A0A314ZQL7_PRUYE|nr:uncharacterized protein Pyn_31229 [Prunus yedoensis var. nudiflora]
MTGNQFSSGLWRGKEITWRSRAPFILEWSPTLHYSHGPTPGEAAEIVGRTQKSVVRALATESASPPPAKMVKAIRVHELGGPEVLKWEDVEVGEPKEGEVRVKNKAIGLNFIDVYFRKGVYKAATVPYTPGVEACGVVTAVGPGLTGRQVGDLVAMLVSQWAHMRKSRSFLQTELCLFLLPLILLLLHPSCSRQRLEFQEPHIKSVNEDSLNYKTRDNHILVEPGHTVLVHAAAGGVGSLLCQWANALGATVIGTVSTKLKAAQAKEDGCHHVIIYKEEDFVARVKEITSDNGVEVVYDSVGKDTFEGSLACLKTRGYMVSFGQSSGAPDPVPLSAIAVKSLFLTRPSLFHYAVTRDELLGMAGEVFGNVQSSVLRVRVNHTYPLSEAAQAHEDLENRKTSRSVLLIP